MEINMAVKKFFDHVRRDSLLDIASAVGYPVRILRLAVNAYAGARSLVMDSNMVSGDIWSSRGVAAGSPRATSRPRRTS